MMPFQHMDARGHGVTLASDSDSVTLTIRGRHRESLRWEEETANLSYDAIESIYLGLSQQQTGLGVMSQEGHAVSGRWDRGQRKVVIQINDGLDVELDYVALAWLSLKMTAWNFRGRPTK